MMVDGRNPKGRFAPSPSGRMHLGNVFTALLSWLSAKSKGGEWVLRIEDLDPQRSKIEYAKLIEDDLNWLGLEWDEGGLDNRGPSAPYSQSSRGEIYGDYLNRLVDKGLTYPCYCSRADIMATQAPHESDGRIVYAGTCRPSGSTMRVAADSSGRPPSTRIMVPDCRLSFSDVLCGPQAVNLASHCGDFVLRRGDGAWAYQLAVVVDDALMGITEVVRGNDLLLSTAQQIYLAAQLGFEAPTYCHVPLICNADGVRLSKRDESLSLANLRLRFSSGEIVGALACVAGLIERPESCSPQDLLPLFSWDKLPAEKTIKFDSGLESIRNAKRN